MALEEWKLRLTSAKVEVEVEAELGKNQRPGEKQTNFFMSAPIHLLVYCTLIVKC